MYLSAYPVSDGSVKLDDPIGWVNCKGNLNVLVEMGPLQSEREGIAFLIRCFHTCYDTSDGFIVRYFPGTFYLNGWRRVPELAVT